jgi:hypothetical protein
MNNSDTRPQTGPDAVPADEAAMQPDAAPAAPKASTSLDR